MCELFGMSARMPTDADGSLGLFAPRGGLTAHHADGWGVALYEGRALRLVKEPRPAADSRCLAFVVGQHMESPTVVAHIRRANPPRYGRTLANTHPFDRELGGRSWAYAHNGMLPGVTTDARLRPRRFRPIGDTDSEHAFCLLLDRLVRVPVHDRDDADALAAALLPITKRLAVRGVLNYLLTDGELLFVHAHTRLQERVRTCETCDGAQQVVLVATQPLTDEPWQPLEPGTLHVYRRGERLFTLRTVPPTAETWEMSGTPPYPAERHAEAEKGTETHAAA